MLGFKRKPRLDRDAEEQRLLGVIWRSATSTRADEQDDATGLLAIMYGAPEVATARLHAYADANGLDLSLLWPEPVADIGPHVKLPENADPAKDWDRIVRAVGQNLGTERIARLDADGGRWVARPLVARTLTLSNDAKPTDGERLDSLLGRDGDSLLRFDAWGRRAEAGPLDATTRRVRARLADHIGVRPWEIDVTLGYDEDGNIALVVVDRAPTMSSADKRTKTWAEAITSVIPGGTAGWRVHDDAQRERVFLVYGAPERLPDLVPLADLLPDAIRLDEWSMLPVGIGTDSEPVSINLAAGPHGLVVGPTGSGKLQPLDSLVPVPASAGGSGWARWGDLEPGDLLYATDGSIIAAPYFTDPREVEVWEVELDDGQVIEVGPEHSWVVSDAKAREQGTPRSQRRHYTGVIERAAEAERVREIARNLPMGSMSTAADLTRIVGSGRINALLHDWNLPCEDRTVELKQASGTYTQDVMHWRADDLRELGYDIDGNDEWVQTPGNSKDERNDARPALQAAGIESQMLPATITRSGTTRSCTLTFYPTDEALMRWADHLEAREHPLAPMTQVRTTVELAEKLTRTGGGTNWSIELPVAIDGPDADLPIDPYVLGVWLGDGNSRTGALTQSIHGTNSSDNWEIRKALAARGYDTHLTGDLMNVRVEGLTAELRAAGLIQNKHIPGLYRRASIAQRLEVLRGLMDTDGTIRKQGACELSLSDEVLATDALELIRSLGIKASMSTGKSGYRNDDGEFVQCKDRHRIHFTTTQRVFNLARKVDRLPMTTRATTQRLYIKDVRPTGRTAQMRCAYVDHPDHQYLTGGFVPTHNTILLLTWVAQALMRGHEVVIVDPTKAGLDFATIRPWTVAWADTLPLAQATMERVYEEVTRRKAVLQQYGEVKWSDLNPQVRRAERIHPVTVVLDEYGSLVMEEPIPKGLGKDHPYVVDAQERNAARAIVASITGRVAREARFVGIHLSIGLQRPDAAIVSGEMRSNLTSGVQLSAPGKPPSREALTMLFPGETAAHVDEVLRALDDGKSRGLGVIAADGGQARGLRVGYAPARQIPELLTERGVPQPTPWTGIKNPAAEPEFTPIDFNLFGNPPEPDPEPFVDAGFSLDATPEPGAVDLSHLVTDVPADDLWA